MSFIRSDDPDRDFLVYDAMKQAEQDEYDRHCVECPWCKQPIRQYEDPYCYLINDDACAHSECLYEMFRKMRPLFKNRPIQAELFDAMEIAFEENNEIRTPEPEIGDY